MSPLLAALLEPLGLPDPTAALAKLLRYRDLIQRYGERLNLVGCLDGDFIAGELIAGSLQILRLAHPAGALVDVGSGAGLPGIPLAIACPDLDVTLVEPRAKRAAFLRRAVQILGLGRVSVLARPVEEVTGPFDWAVSRAFRPPAVWLSLAPRLVRAGGHIAVYATRAAWESVDVPPGLVRVGDMADPIAPERCVAVLEVAG